ncbi:type IIL restriction-modification enzyme MmeI [Paraburkholderia sp. CI3]|uniref:type IIL restriction-modification enzyme MmeI n=1 Tax=Paraburkholderia sp. CI3 TaxID=2991060 RepID=UPI003D24D372
MRRSISSLNRFIVTPEVSKHRVFAWLRANTIPNKNLIVFARSDDVMFGILHSRFHEVWSLRLGTSLEDRPRYTNSTVFETFPLPPGLAPSQSLGDPLDEGDYVVPPVEEAMLPTARNIAACAARLNALRESWLNPKEWVERVSEIAADYPERVVPKKEHVEEIQAEIRNRFSDARPGTPARDHPCRARSRRARRAASGQ